MPEFTRRQIVTTGAIAATGLAGAIAANNVAANTLNPPEPESNSVEPNGRFSEKVALKIDFHGLECRISVMDCCSDYRSNLWYWRYNS